MSTLREMAQELEKREQPRIYVPRPITHEELIELDPRSLIEIESDMFSKPAFGPL